MTRFLAISTFLLLFTSDIFSVTYTVHFDQAKAHYISITVQTEIQNKDYIDFVVPVWTPGSYKLREFSQSYENVTYNGGLRGERINKNTWRLYTKGFEELHLKYDVYCNIISARQSYVDEYYAFLHGVSVFGYLDGYAHLPITLNIMPLSNWKNVEVALPESKTKKHSYTCTNFDLLADSPIALGNFETTDYVSGNVPHRVVMIGEGNYDLKAINRDFKKIGDYFVEMFGDHPSPQYTHFVYNTGSGGGGLEHLNSQTSVMNRWNYTNPTAYSSFLRLIAHEYFHLWNVKRIRPVTLGPFDYTTEVYTDMLWICEGFTSYFDDYAAFQCGFTDETQYLAAVEANINRYENTPGKYVMTLAESSTCAWVEAYLPNEESNNTSISYYNKGMLVGILLDFSLREKGSSLAKVLNVLYKDFYKKENRGFTFEEFLAVVNAEAKTDMKDFFDRYVYTTKAIDYESIFSKFGMSLKETARKQPYTGTKSSISNGTSIIKNIDSKSPAIEAGLSVGDEIIAIDGWRLTMDFEEYIKSKPMATEFDILFSRDGKLITTVLKPSEDPTIIYSIEITDPENKLLMEWLNP